MKYSPEQEITIDNRKLYVISSINYEGKNYIYTQEIDEEQDDLKLDYFLYEVGETDKLVTDEQLINKLLKEFYRVLEKEM